MLTWSQFKGGRHTETSAYGDTFAVVRFDFTDGKQFRPIHRTGDRWTLGDPPGALPLYRLTELQAADPTEIVILTEGEKCADRVAGLGFVATTSAHGSKSANKSDWTPLAGKSVVVLPDCDKTGEGYATDVGGILSALDPPATVRILRLPDLGDGGDICDWADAQRDECDVADLLGELIETQSEPFTPTAPAVTAEPDAGTDTPESFTELHVAELLAERHAGRIRYCLERGWLHWTATHWADDKVGTADRLTKQTIRDCYGLLGNIDNRDRRDAEFRRIRGLESSNRIAGVKKLAQSEPAIRVPVDDLDRNLWLLNVANGTLDLRADKFRQHDPNDLLTKVAGVAYDPDATAPRWERFLQEVFDCDADLIAFVQRAVGYSLTGDISEQCLFLCHGGGANGKSVFQSTIQTLMGDYAEQSDASAFMAKRDDNVRSDIARLAGVRFVGVPEVAEGRRMAEGLVKGVTGGDKIVCRFLYREFFSFLPQFKLWLSANHRPEVREQTHAIWRRIRLVPFAVTIAEADRDPKLTDTLRAELPGVLFWALAGLRDWRQSGLRAPAAVVNATADYRREQDTLGEFLKTACQKAAGNRVAAKTLWEAYVEWSGEKVGIRRFGVRIRERGFVLGDRSTDGKRFWLGLGLLG